MTAKFSSYGSAMMNSHREFEVSTLLAFVRMPTVVQNCEIFRAIVLIVEVGHSFV